MAYIYIYKYDIYSIYICISNILFILYFYTHIYTFIISGEIGSTNKTICCRQQIGSRWCDKGSYSKVWGKINS